MTRKRLTEAEIDRRLAKHGHVRRIGPFKKSSIPVKLECVHHGVEKERTVQRYLEGARLNCCAADIRAENGLKKILAAAKKYDSELKEKNPGLVRIGPYIKAITKIKHFCIHHQQFGDISPNNALKPHGMSCCYTSHQLNWARNRHLKAKATFDARLEVSNPTKIRIDPYIGNDKKINFYCTTHCEVHEAQPAHMLAGEGLRCCGIAAVREVGRKTGPLNGILMDNVWRALLGELSRQGPTKLYLFSTAVDGINKFGISFNPEIRPKGIARKKLYKKQILKPSFHFSRREDAVLIEQAYKFGWGCKPPKTLEDIKGSNEVTKASLDEFIETINELIEAFSFLGPWGFAEEYCDPQEVAIARQKLEGQDAA